MKTLTNIFITLILAISLNSSSLFSQWQQVYGGSGSFLHKVVAVNSNVIVASGEQGIILRSSNGGSNWQSITTGTPYGIVDLSFKGNTGIAVTSEYGLYLKSTDGGLSWVSFNLGGNFSVIYSKCQVLNDSTYYLISNQFINNGNIHIIYKTTNRGANWNEVFYGINSTYDFQFITEQIGYKYTNYELFRTIDGGASWTSKGSFFGACFFFADENTGYITGIVGSTRIYKTTTGGSNWVLLSFPNGALGIRRINFINANIGMALADSGVTFRTTNGGSVWTTENTGYTNPWGLNDICLTNNNEAITVGSFSVIFKYTGLTGVTSNTNSMPNKFSLSQNYPNPFNPSTKINFTVSKQSSVKIAVYDMLGKEVETLVNENMNAGSYSVSWNASNYSSGVYFYKLVTDGFTETKKMILTK